MTDLEKLKTDMGELDEKAVLEDVQALAPSDAAGCSAVISAISEGMLIVGRKFDDLEYFVGDLIFASYLFNEVIDIIRPVFSPPEGRMGGGRILLATVEGDIHDIGKNLVKMTLESNGMEVIDLGVNISPDTIVNTAAAQNIKIVALSGVLTIAEESMKRTVDAFKSRGMRDKVTILIGGACTNERVLKQVGADYYCTTPENTSEICRKLLRSEVRSPVKR